MRECMWDGWRQLLFSIYSNSNYDSKPTESKVIEKEERKEHK
jgi:hypothetical protein